MTASEVVGFSGTAIAGYAYLPQITHLVRERCSAGLSERAFALWFAASALMTVHAITIGALVFVVLGIEQVGATGLIAFYCRRYRDHVCPSHEPRQRYVRLRRPSPGVQRFPSRPRLPGCGRPLPRFNVETAGDQSAR